MPRYFDDTIIECPACPRTFPTTQGLNCHLSSAKSCKWYRKGKNRELTVIEQSNVSADSTEPTSYSDDPLVWPPPFEDTNNDDPDPLHNIECDEFVLLLQEVHIPQEGQAGPRPATQAARSQNNPNLYCALDDEDDTRFVVEHPTAGRVFFKQPSSNMNPNNRMETCDRDGDTEMEDGTKDRSPHYPFMSELDWRVAEWAVKNGPGQKAFNRFLAIPGVSCYILFVF